MDVRWMKWKVNVGEVNEVALEVGEAWLGV